MKDTLVREHQIKEQESPAQIKVIRAKLIDAEKSGFSSQTAEQILKEIKDGLRIPTS